MNFDTPLYFDEKNVGLDRLCENIVFKPFFNLINEQAKLNPSRAAIKFNETYWSYQTIVESSNKLARFLISNGIKTGDIIGLAVDRSPEMVVLLLAIVKSGAAYVPLDPNYPKDRIEFMLADSTANVLLTTKKYEKYYNCNARELLIEDVWPQLEQFAATELNTTILAHEVAYILYTSGSTGKPKGVVITHGSLANFLLSMQKLPGINSNDNLLAISTISFDIAGLELYLPLTAGAKIVLASTETAKDGWLLLELMKREKITIMQATPYTWRMIIAAGWNEFLPVRIITGGEPLSKDLAAKLLPLCSELWNQYGPTETTIYSTQKLITTEEEITIGKPIDNTEVYILDDLLQKQPDGVVGEIFICGEGIAKGYLNRPQQTEDRFVNNPFSNKPEAKMYRTGDVGLITSNGEIQYLGRSDHQVKIRGFRIELEEIEHALLIAKFVKEAVVTIKNDIGDPYLIAYVVTTSDTTESTKAELKQILAGVLPDYMIPNNIWFIPSIPVTPNGKVNRVALPGLIIQNAEAEKGYIAPITETEKQVAEIWQDLMGVNQISIDSNFFALGGRSLLAVQVMARVAKITGKHLPISVLLNNPTIRELASYLNLDEITNGWNSLVALRREGTKIPLYIIHGEGLNVLYFNDLAMNMDKSQPVYGLQARGLKGDEPLEDMQEMAAKYIEEILDQNPDGPYYLAGYSFGGYVAIEMRRQLSSMGKEVKIIIFDSDAEKSEFKSLSYLLPRKIKKNLPRIISLVKSALLNPIGTIKQTIKDIRLKQTIKGDSKEFYRQIKKIQNKLRIALKNYTIDPFDDKVYLYKASVCTHYVDDKDFLGWKKYAKKGVEVCEVSGDHLSMLLHPNVEDFAIKLQKGLDKITC